MNTTEAKPGAPTPPGRFINYLIENGLPSRRAVNKDEDLEIHWLDLTQLKLNVGHFTPFVVAPGLPQQNIIPAERVTPLVKTIKETFRRRGSDTLGRADANFTVLVIGGRLKDAKEPFWDQLREQNIALVDKPVIDAIYGEKHLEQKARHLCTAFIRSLGYEALSPYRVGQPAYGSTFFGRGRILQTILGGKRGSSYTFIGNRRIGKTSLLQEIRHRLRLRDPDIHTAWVYGGTVNSTEQLLKEILVRLDPLYARNAADPSSIMELFPAYIQSIPDKQNREVVVFIDELDHILEFDALQDYELLELLRATFEHEECRIFFAGFRRTREAARHMNTPLFNFTTPVDLARLTREETLEMITRPLRLLGLDIANNELPTAVHRETGGHPELIQIFGKEIVSSLESKGKIPDTSDLLACVLESQLFREKVLGTFLSNTTPYEELICYLLIEAKGDRKITDFEFGYDLVNLLLKAKGFRLRMRELQGIVRNLETAGVLAPVTGVSIEKFTFCVPQLARYCANMDLKVCIETALERVQTTPDEETALWGDVGRDLELFEEAGD